MKNLNRIISVALSLCLVLSILPKVDAFAENKHMLIHNKGEAKVAVATKPIAADSKLINEKENVDFDINSHNTKSTKTWELYTYLEKRDMLSNIAFNYGFAIDKLKQYYTNHCSKEQTVEQKMLKYFSSDELVSIRAANANYSLDNMYMLFLCAMESKSIHDSDKDSIKKLIIQGNTIYDTAMTFIRYESKEPTQKDFEIDRFLTKKVEDKNKMKDTSEDISSNNAPSTALTSTTVSTLSTDSSSSSGEQLYDQYMLENKYYQKLDGNISVGDAIGNVSYSYNLVSMPEKNGLKMNLNLSYDSTRAKGLNYYSEEDTDAHVYSARSNVKNTSLGIGWNFPLTHIEEDYCRMLVLEDGRSFSLSSYNDYTIYCNFDDVKYSNGKITYLDGTVDTIGSNGYISKRTDKYGNNIFYEYQTYSDIANYKDTEYRLVKMTDDLNRQITITYNDNSTVITRPDGSTINLQKDYLHLYNIGATEHLYLSDDVPILGGIKDVNTDTPMACFSYDSKDIRYSTIHGGGFMDCSYSAFILMTYYEGMDGKDYAFNWDAIQNPNSDDGYATFYNASVTGYSKNGIGTYMSYTYGEMVNDKYNVTKVSSDNLVTVSTYNKTGNCINVDTYKRNNNIDTLKQSKVITYVYDTIYSPPSSIEIKTYNDSGNYIDKKTVVTYNTHKQVDTENTFIDGNAYIDTYNTYNSDSYSSLQSTQTKKGNTVLATTSYTVNLLGDITSKTIPDSYIEQYYYDQYNNLIRKENNDGQVLKQEEYQYDSNNMYMIKIYTKDSLGNIIAQKAYSYNNIGLLNSRDEGDNSKTSYQYDSLGRQTKESYLDNSYNEIASKKIYYNYIDQIIQVQDENGENVDYFEGGGVLYKVDQYSNDSDRVTLQSALYDINDRPYQIKDANENTTTISYDTFGRQTQVVYPPVDSNPSQPIKAKYYDVFLEGDTKYSMSMTITGENKISCKYYDIYGRLAKTTIVSNPDTLLANSDIDTMIQMPSNVTMITTMTYTYDDLGRVINKVDGEARPTTYTYDALGNVLTSIQGNDGESICVSYQYNKAGKLIQMTQADHVTTYEYDRAGRLIKTTDPIGYTEENIYDKCGNIVQSKDKNNVWATNVYDNRNRLVQITKGNKHIFYTYDGVGNILTIQNDSDTITNEYNLDGTLKKKTMPDGKSIQYTGYDNAKNLLSFTDYFGTQTDYTYNQRNQINSITQNSDTTSYEYYQDNQLKKINYPTSTGVTSEYQYNYMGLPSNLQTQKGTTLIDGWDIQYDATGNKAFEHDLTGQNPWNGHIYCYDSVGRLCCEIDDTNDIGFTYDQSNNIAEKIVIFGDNERKEIYAYDANNRVTSMTTNAVDSSQGYPIIGDVTSSCDYAYDNNGNLSSKSSNTNFTSYGYDEFNRLTGYNDDTAITTYAYYPDGTRSSKTTGSNTTNFYYNGMYVVNEQKGTTVSRNLRGVNGWISRKDTQTSNPYYYVQNTHGDVRKLFDASGNVMANYDFDGYGNQYGSPVNNNPFGYSGEYKDSETGLIYLRARMYDPGMGRFISEDPHWNPSNMIYGDKQYKDGKTKVPDINAIMQSNNLYGYCLNNPVNWVDPTGLSYSDVINALYIIYEQKNIMTQNSPDSYDYQDALDKANEAKQTIANSHVYIQDESGLKNKLSPIVNGNNNTLKNIQNTYNKVKKAEKKDENSHKIAVTFNVNLGPIMDEIYGNDYSCQYDAIIDNSISTPSPKPHSGMDDYDDGF